MSKLKKARDLYHEQNPDHCLLADPEDDNGMSSHRHQCDEWQAHERSVKADVLRKMAKYCGPSGNVTYAELLVIADRIEKGESAWA